MNYIEQIEQFLIAGDIELAKTLMESIKDELDVYCELENKYEELLMLKDIDNVFDLFELKKLDLNNLGLVSIPECVFSLKHLLVLNLSENNLIEIPTQIKDLQNLTLLDLGYNKIKALPNELFELVNLVFLILNANDITKIPSEIKHLTKLVELLVCDNTKLKELPKELELINLVNLGVSNTGIKNLPELKLEYLFMDNCDLQYIPTSVLNMKTLLLIDLYNNKLKEFPINNLSNLRYLNLKNNCFNKLPELKNSPKLEHLILKNNQIKYYPKVCQYNNKVVVYLYGNPCKKIKSEQYNFLNL